MAKEPLKQIVALGFIFALGCTVAVGAESPLDPHCRRVLDDAGQVTVICEPFPPSPEPTRPPFVPPLVERGDSALKPVRALIEPSEMPPREVGAYGIVAFPSLPLPREVVRYEAVCQAFKATLIPQDQLSSDVSLRDQMITFWPIIKKSSTEALDGKCDYLVANYALGLGLDAIQDADKQAEGLARKRGPFLIAWSPARSRLVKDAVVLVFDLSNIESQESFLDVFKAYRAKIVDDPNLWRRGFEWFTLRLALRDVLDRYGDGLMRLIKGSADLTTDKPAPR